MEELKQIQFHGENEETFSVTFSAGLASFPDEAEDLQELVKVADRRLYLAKERGRKLVVIDD
jgi:diguanylate cyclase (GGDEF)-like protein